MTWWHLRSVGNLKVLKVSYAVLVLVPVLSHYETVVSYLGIKPWFLAAVFFASLFLALANLIYDIACPTIVKRFASPNDLYREMLVIRELAARMYPLDEFDASLDHCVPAYRDAANERPWSRFLCATFYFAAGILFAIIFAYRSWLVVKFVMN